MPLDQDLAFAGIPAWGRALRAGEYSCVELTEFFLQRLERHGPTYNAVVRVTREIALAQARQADAELKDGKDRGPLHGIPYGVKDLLSTPGIPTTWGAAPFRDRVLDEEATIIAKLRDAGAVLVAKLAMVELAGGMGYRQANAAFNGPGRNAWNPDRWSGGSSSGSGSAVGAGLVGFAIGSETWGSIVNPAAYNGITGLRPTFGRVSRFGAMALSWTLDKLGPMARSAEDCRLVLTAIAGVDAKDASTIPLPMFAPQADGPQRRLRIGIPTDAVTEVQPAVRQNFEQAVELLKADHDISPIEFPDYPYGSIASLTIDCEMAAAFEPMIHSGEVWELTAEEDRRGAHAATMIPAKDYLNAQRIRAIVQRNMHKLRDSFDAFLAPTDATAADPIGQDFALWGRGFHGSELGAIGNICGMPAISVPNGFDADGLPTGMQFVTHPGDEHTAFAAAESWQSRTDWHQRQPEVLAR